MKGHQHTRALILAAGIGSRMGTYTEQCPKGMLEYCGKPLLRWQIDALRSAGVKEIGIVTGYLSDRVSLPGVPDLHFFSNPEYATTNMVASMLHAFEFIKDGAIISYADLIFHSQLIPSLLSGTGAMNVAVDFDWRSYWQLRHGSTETDLESLEIDPQGRITALGQPRSSSAGISARYIGLNAFSAEAINAAREIYTQKVRRNEPWEQSGKSAPQGYMTDLISELIAQGYPAVAVGTHAGWLEFDTVADYEIARSQAHTPRFAPTMLGISASVVLHSAPPPHEAALRQALAAAMRSDFARIDNAPGAMDRFVTKRYAALQRLGVEQRLGTLQKHASNDVFTTCMSELQEERSATAVTPDGNSSAERIARLIKGILPTGQWTEAAHGEIDFLQKRIEVAKRLAAHFDQNGKPAPDSVLTPEPYALLACALCHRAAMTNRLGYLSTALKINDALATAFSPQQWTRPELFAVSIALELATISLITGEQHEG